jgi:hypothetical protein
MSTSAGNTSLYAGTSMTSSNVRHSRKTFSNMAHVSARTPGAQAPAGELAHKPLK